MKIDVFSAIAFLILICVHCTLVGFFLFKSWNRLATCKTATDVLQAIIKERRIASLSFTISLALLLFAQVVKGLMLITGHFIDSPLTLAAFGVKEQKGVCGSFGGVGLILLATMAYCGLRYLRSSHYIQVITAFRTKLGISDEFEKSHLGNIGGHNRKGGGEKDS